MATKAKELPKAEQATVATPEQGTMRKATPDALELSRPAPNLGVGIPENMIKIGDEFVEIKPMKLKYIRNRTAAFRHILETYPLSDIYAMVNPFGDGRDGDKAVYDWLVAVTDNEELVRKYYDDLDSDTIYKLLLIHRRVEKIDEMEEKLKNSATPGEA